jgi:hypothetical protein
VSQTRDAHHEAVDAQSAAFCLFVAKVVRGSLMKQQNISLSNVLAQQLANLGDRLSSLAYTKQRQPKIRSIEDDRLLLSVGQSVLNRRERTVSQYNLVELEKAIDLAG